jgi:hypothetical protein
MLIARILAARAELPELAATLDQIDAGGLDPDEQLVHRSLVAVAGRTGAAAWGELIADSARLPASPRLEIALLAARCGRLDGPHRDEARALASSTPLVTGRLGEL